jgi:hypothetical protein
MNPRSLIITTGTVVALAVPAAAGAKMLPTVHVAKSAKHAKIAKPNFRRQGEPLQRYIHVSFPVSPTPPSPRELCDQVNDDLILHALDPVDCSAADAQTATSLTYAAVDQATQTDTSTLANSSDSAGSQVASTAGNTTLTDPDADC